MSRGLLTRFVTFETDDMLPERFGYPLRLACFGVFCAVLYAGVYATIESMGGAAGAENGPLELLQVGFAIIASCLFLRAAWISPRGVAGLATCGAMMAYASARESDQWFEAVFFDDAYKYLVGIPAILLVFSVAWRYRRGILQQTTDLLNEPPATLFILGGVYLAFVCQMLDRPSVWGNLHMASDTASIKPMIEEAMEVFAYATIAYSAIESIIFARKSKSSMVKKDHEQPATIRIAA